MLYTGEELVQLSQRPLLIKTLPTVSFQVGTFRRHVLSLQLVMVSLGGEILVEVIGKYCASVS